MLIFTDKPHAVRVTRVTQSDDGNARVRIGNIRKPGFEIPPEVASALSAEELREAKAVIAVYREAAALDAALSTARLPAVVREAVERCCSAAANDAERRLVVGALSEGLRRLRNHEKKAAKADGA